MRCTRSSGPCGICNRGASQCRRPWQTRQRWWRDGLEKRRPRMVISGSAASAIGVEMDLLKRELAPIVDEAWGEIDLEAKRVLKLNLAGRKLVDFDGPHGWEYAGVNTGQLKLLKTPPEPGVFAGLRIVQPLFEVRVPFELSIMDLDTVPRGAKNIDLDPVVAAAEKLSRAEDDAIFNGLTAGGMTGI